MEKLGKNLIKRLGRELEIKGIVTLFHKRFHSLPLTKGLAGGVYEVHAGYRPPF